MSLPILLGVQRWAFIGRPAQGDGASFSEIMGWSSGGVEQGRRWWLQRCGEKCAELKKWYKVATGVGGVLHHALPRRWRRSLWTNLSWVVVGEAVVLDVVSQNPFLIGARCDRQ